MTSTLASGKRPYRLTYRTTSIREHCLVSARVRVESVPGHPCAPQLHLDLVGLLPSTVIQLRALGTVYGQTYYFAEVAV